MNPESICEIVGFDFGHGETAAALVSLDGIPHPEMLEVNSRRNWVTAIARHPSRGVLVGAEAIGMPGVTELDLAFKGIPSDDPHYRKQIREYMRACHEKFLDAHHIRGEAETGYIVGCPSGWNERERADYEALLKESGIESLKVVSESRAAFMHAKESGKFTSEELFKSILVIDVGSSTTDYTAVSGLTQIPVDFGHNCLGAGLIDDAIFSHVTEHHQESAALKAAFEKNNTHVARCRFCCRTTKEKFFSNEEMYRENGMPAKGYEDVGLDLDFPVKISPELMDRILKSPLEKLGNKSWPDAFRQSLKDTRKLLKEQDTTPEFILMTGGASRMRFLQGIVEEVFPDATLRNDSEPQFMVARGLARVGRWDNLVTRFMGEVDRLSESGRIREILEANVTRLIDLLVDPINEGLFRHAIRPALEEWQKYQLKKLSQLETRIPELAEEWLLSENGVLTIADVCARWLEGIRDQLERETIPLTRKYHLPGGGLKIDVSFVYIPRDPGRYNFLTLVVGILVSVLLGSIAGGTGVALIHTGPIGVIAGIVVGLVGTMLGMDYVRERLKEVNVPIGRGILLSDSRIEKIYREKHEVFEDRLREWMEGGEESQSTFNNFVDEVHDRVHDALIEAARKVLIDIR